MLFVQVLDEIDLSIITDKFLRRSPKGSRFDNEMFIMEEYFLK